MCKLPRGQVWCNCRADDLSRLHHKCDNIGSIVRSFDRLQVQQRLRRSRRWDVHRVFAWNIQE